MKPDVGTASHQFIHLKHVQIQAFRAGTLTTAIKYQKGSRKATYSKGQTSGVLVCKDLGAPAKHHVAKLFPNNPFPSPSHPQCLLHSYQATCLAWYRLV